MKALKEAQSRRDTMVGATAELQERVARARLEGNEAVNEARREAALKIAELESELRAADGRANQAAQAAQLSAQEIREMEEAHDNEVGRGAFFLPLFGGQGGPSFKADVA